MGGRTNTEHLVIGITDDREDILFFLYVPICFSIFLTIYFRGIVERFLKTTKFTVIVVNNLLVVSNFYLLIFITVGSDSSVADIMP